MKSTVLNLDGAPVDAHKMAADAGFGCTLTLTKSAWEDCVAWNPDEEDCAGQSESGRLWDVLSAASNAHSEAIQRGAVRCVSFRPSGGILRKWETLRRGFLAALEMTLSVVLNIREKSGVRPAERCAAPISVKLLAR